MNSLAAKNMRFLSQSEEIFRGPEKSPRLSGGWHVPWLTCIAMQILLGNSVDITTRGEFRIHHSVPVDFEDLAVFQLSVPPTSPREPAVAQAAGSLLPSARATGAVGRTPAFNSPVFPRKEPAASFAAGSPSSPMFEEYMKPESLDWAEDFTNDHTAALSDWPL